MKSLLILANRAIEDKKDKINPRWYPHFHLAPQAGWMNDPNGLVWFDGYYHAFFQHHPYSPVWGPMHWGHARSRDMVHWEHLPISLAPEGQEDKDGCFSGSAVVDGDKLALIYTGHKFHGQPNDENLYQVQCLATSTDGVNFQREGMIIDTPAGLHHFRDPKVWREGEHWYMVVGARVDNIGEVQLYCSTDLHHWEYEGLISKADENQGYMWECPDFFRLGNKHLLMISPQGIKAKGYDYRNLYQSGYIVGTWQPGTPFNIEQSFREMDFGHDFYAPQTFETPDGRRIVIGWLAMWESPMLEKEDGWAGMLSLPRELSLSDDLSLRMNPVKELETLRKQALVWSVGELCNQSIQIAEQANAIEIYLEWNVANSDAEQYGLAIGNCARIYVDNQSRRVVLERYSSELALNGYRSVPLPEGNSLSLCLFIDSSSVELFVNQGEYVLSSRIYPEDGNRQLSLFSQQGKAVVLRANGWQLAG